MNTAFFSDFAFAKAASRSSVDSKTRRVSNLSSLGSSTFGVLAAVAARQAARNGAKNKRKKRHRKHNFFHRLLIFTGLKMMFLIRY
jgi:hypothetical protein